MDTHFTHIGLIGKLGDSNIVSTLRALTAHLEQKRVGILLDRSVADFLPDSPHALVDRETLAQRCDLAIVVGGDGTLLNAARDLAESGVAVLGVNLGRIGFLVDVSPEDMPAQLDKVLSGDFSDEQRTLLHMTVSRNGRTLGESSALNDVVVHKKNIARMIELDTWIDSHFLNTNRSDGLIVSTPTGSTAYALSGGGPILHTRLDAITLVPICPHTLSNRPIVIHDESVIEIIIHQGTLEAMVSCDGQYDYSLQAGDHITIRKHDHALRLLHPPGHDYFAVLRKKLRWSEQP
jgi:NAD+ kinase